MDLPLSIKINNIRPMIEAGLDNLQLTRYLIDQVRQSTDERMEALRAFVPNALEADWKLEMAGQRVQIMSRTRKKAASWSLAPKWSAQQMAPFQRCWALRRALPRPYPLCWGCYNAAFRSSSLPRPGRKS